MTDIDISKLGKMVPESHKAQTPAAKVESALHALALNSGQLNRTADELGMPRSTLCEWRKRHHDRYLEIRESVVPVLYKQVAQENEDLALAAVDAERTMLARVLETAPDLKPSETSASLRNISVTKGIAMGKAMEIRDLPAREQERRDLAKLTRSLATRFPVFVRSEAVVEDQASVALAARTDE